MTVHRFLWTTLAALAGVAALFAFQATAQPPPNSLNVPQRVVEAREDGSLVERFVDADGKRYIDERLPDGTVHRRPFDGNFVQTVQGQPPGAANWFTPMRMPDGRHVYGVGVQAPDPETQKLFDQEQAAAQEVRTLASGAIGPDSEVKKRLREKLAQIFDLQQQRRTQEIAKIEERLGKLKETLKKRETSKDSIVDRRLETLTGGVDELGWEETFPNEANPYGPKGPNTSFPSYPPTVPRAPQPNFGPPANTPAPPPVGARPVAPALPTPPRAGAPPAAANPFATLPALGPAADEPAAAPAAPPTPTVEPPPTASSDAPPAAPPTPALTPPPAR